MICHPYLSLQYYDILQDPNVRGFVVGASNILYKQKRNAVDVITEVRVTKRSGSTRGHVQVRANPGSQQWSWSVWGHDGGLVIPG